MAACIERRKESQQELKLQYHKFKNEYEEIGHKNPMKFHATLLFSATPCSF